MIIHRNSKESIPDLPHRFNTGEGGMPFPEPDDHTGVAVRTGGGYVHMVVLDGLGQPPPVIHEEGEEISVAVGMQYGFIPGGVGLFAFLLGHLR